MLLARHSRFLNIIHCLRPSTRRGREIRTAGNKNQRSKEKFEKIL
jgi:hypothetical protein